MQREGTFTLDKVTFQPKPKELAGQREEWGKEVFPRKRILSIKWRKRQKLREKLGGGGTHL